MIDVYKDMNTLTKLNIFAKFPLEHLDHLLKCCGAYYKFYKKNEIVFLQGNKVDSLCIIISGSVSIEKIDILGNNTYMLDIYEGNFFGEQIVLDKPSISPYTYRCSS